MWNGAYQRPQIRKLFDKFAFWDGAKSNVVVSSDGGHPQWPNARRRKLRRNEAVIAAANLQEGNGEAVDVYLRVVRGDCLEDGRYNASAQMLLATQVTHQVARGGKQENVHSRISGAV